MNQHIGRLQAIGMGKEGTAGNKVSASYWIPKTAGVLKPMMDKANDESGYGNIDQRYDSITVKEKAEVTLEGIIRDEFFGMPLLAALGSETLGIYAILSSLSGTFTIGETVTGGTSSATGTVVRTANANSGNIVIKIASGTFQTGETITGGTSSATATITFSSSVHAHIFERLNTNNHPSFTIYGYDPVGTNYSTYMMLNELNIQLDAGDYCRFTASFMGKKLQSDTTPSVSYSTDNEFAGRHVNLYLADTFAGLESASATELKNLNLNIVKNLLEYQALGDDDLASLHNQQLSVAGDLTALFDSETLLGLVRNSTKKYARIEIIDTNITIGSADNPRLVIDLGKVSFEERDKTGDNDAIVEQTMAFTAEFNNDDGYTIRAELHNTKSAVY